MICLVRGKILPRQSLPIKVTFMAIEAPAFHDIDLVCEIYNETTLTQYHIDLKRWESTIQEKWERFEIDDQEYEACLRSGILDDNDKLLPSSSAASQNQFQQGSTLQMCKTLPPVLVNYQLDESNVDRTRRLRANMKRQLNMRPQMPMPELLHFAFTARTLVYQEYLDLCQDTTQLQRFFIDTCLGGDYREKNLKNSLNTDEDEQQQQQQSNEQITATVDEADLLRSTLADLLRNLLSDRVFADTLPDMIAEPIPFFTQLQYTKMSNDDQQSSNDSLDRGYPEEQDRSLAWSIDDHGKALFQRKEKASKHRRLSPQSSTDFGTKISFDENDNLINNPNLTSVIEEVLENTLWNILQEAYHNEFSLTSRPRLIALPPKRPSNLLTQINQNKYPTPPLIMTESIE